MTTIYSAYAENDKSKLERMVGYALGLTNLPPPGGPKLMFSLGGEDTQAIYPAVNESIPTSNKSVAIIFNQLGRSPFFYPEHSHVCTTLYFPLLVSVPLIAIFKTEFVFCFASNLIGVAIAKQG